MDQIVTVCGCRSCKKPITLEHEGKTLYFCLEDCKEEFLNAKDKERWLREHQ